MAIAAGASFLGLVGHMPSGPGVIPDSLIDEIAQFAKGKAETVLLSSETSIVGLAEHHAQVNTTCLQIVDALVDGTHEDLRKLIAKNTKLIQVVHIIDKASVAEAVELSKVVDFILLDSGNPTLAIKTLGGTGNTHNWVLSQKIVAEAHCPVFLAGGLKASNVKNAIAQVNPFGLDLCTGVRTDGLLDATKLNDFFEKLG